MIPRRLVEEELIWTSSWMYAANRSEAGRLDFVPAIQGRFPKVDLIGIYSIMVGARNPNEATEIWVGGLMMYRLLATEIVSVEIPIIIRPSEEFYANVSGEMSVGFGFRIREATC